MRSERVQKDPADSQLWHSLNVDHVKGFSGYTKMSDCVKPSCTVVTTFTPLSPFSALNLIHLLRLRAPSSNVLQHL